VDGVSIFRAEPRRCKTHLLHAPYKLDGSRFHVYNPLMSLTRNYFAFAFFFTTRPAGRDWRRTRG
jgi:hypothetical protein